MQLVPLHRERKKSKMADLEKTVDDLRAQVLELEQEKQRWGCASWIQLVSLCVCVCVLPLCVFIISSSSVLCCTSKKRKNTRSSAPILRTLLTLDPMT